MVPHAAAKLDLVLVPVSPQDCLDLAKKNPKHLSDTDDMEGRTDGRMGELINAFVFFSQNALCSTSLPVFACCSIVGLH